MTNTMKCNFCETGELEYIQVKRTSIYVCEQCPNVQLEYNTPDDIDNLHAYLHGKVKPLTREEQLKYIISDYIGYTTYDGNDRILAQEIKLLIDNNEEITINVVDSYNLDNEEEIENIIESLYELAS